MKNGSWRVFCLALSLVLSGCKGFWDLPAGSGGGGGTTPTTLNSGIFYVLNQKTSQIAGYSISSGTLTSISGSPYALAAAPSAIAVASSGTYLYVATINGIYLYSVGSGGALTIANNGTPVSSDIATAMVVSGSWLVDAFPTGGGAVQLDAIPIDPSSGLYTGTGGSPPFQTFSINNATLYQMVLSPDGKNLFLALGAGGTIVVPFTSGNSNPLATSATTIGPLNTGGSALSVAVDPNNRVFYIGETLANSSASSGGLRVFNYSSLGSGTNHPVLTQASGSPIASGGLAPNAILPIASGEYVYVANGTGNTSHGNVAWFPLTASGTTYTIATGKSVGTGVYPIGLAEDSEANFVLAVSTGGSTSSGNYDLEAYTMSSGALTAAIVSATGTDPVGAVAIAALP
jgi:6-phosphogluconolactonase